MTMRNRCKQVAGILALGAAAFVAGPGCGSGPGMLRGGRAVATPAPGTANPYTAMRPVYTSRRGPTYARPVYLSGYGGYNYTRALGGPLVETAYDGRYDRDCPRFLSGRGR